MFRLENLRNWKDRSFSLSDENDWLDLLDDFGPALPRFLLDDSCASSIPADDGALEELRQSLVKHPVSSLKPDIGSVWVLFTFKEDLQGLPPPFRQDGLLLPFEWRKGEADHSRLLPEELTSLAELVKGQFGNGAADCTLHPSRHFLDAVDFHISGATFDSAWGALATGLHLLLSRKKHLTAWPFSSIAYDFTSDTFAAVGELERKFLLAASCGAEEIAVAPVQYKEAKRLLASMQKTRTGNKPLKRLAIFNWRPQGDFRRDVAVLSRCNQDMSRYRRLKTCAWVVILSVLSALSAFSVYDYKRDVYRYFAAATQKFGIYHGENEISKDDVIKYPHHFRFRYQGYGIPPCLGGKRILRGIMFVDAEGKPVLNMPDKHSKVEYSYSEYGEIAKAVHRDTAGQIREELIYDNGDLSKCESINYQQNGAKDETRYFIVFDKSTGQPAHFEIRHGDGRYEILVNDFANHRRIREYHNRDGSWSMDEDGTAIKVHQYGMMPNSPFPQEVAQFYFDANTNRFTNAEGVSGFTNRIDMANRTLECVFIGKDNEPVDSTRGYAIEQRCFDEFGRMSGVWALDSRRRRIYDADVGYYGLKFDYDGEGRCDGISFCDANGQLMASDVLGMATLKRKWVGLECQTRFYSVSNTLCVAKYCGAAGFNDKYDVQGRKTSHAMIDVKEDVCEGTSGIAIQEFEYDSQGRICEERFFDRKRRPASCASSFGKVQLVKKTVCRGLIGNETRIYEICPSEEIGMRVRYIIEQYSEKGEIVSVRFSDKPDGRPVDSALGFARFDVKYNERSEWIEKTVYNEADELAAPGKVNYFSRSIRSIKHESDGIRVKERCLGPELFYLTNGMATAVNAFFTTQGRLIEIHGLDGNGKAARLPKADMFSLVVEYDSLGRVAKLRATPVGGKEAWGNASAFDLRYTDDGSMVTVTAYDRKGVKAKETELSCDAAQKEIKFLSSLVFEKSPLPNIIHEGDAVQVFERFLGNGPFQ